MYGIRLTEWAYHLVFAAGILLVPVSLPVATASDSLQTLELAENRQTSRDSQRGSSSLESLKKHAAAGNIAAMFQLGRLYMVGRGVDRDRRKAVEWFQKAADLGHKEAGRYLMRLDPSSYRRERASVRTPSRAGRGEDIDVLKEKADRGDADAMFELGRCYRFGKGVKRDAGLAKEWFTKASEKGHRRAKSYLRSADGGRAQAAKQRSLRTEAIDILRQKATAGDDQAMYELGTRLLTGKGVERDRDAGIDWLRKSSERGNRSASALVQRLGALAARRDERTRRRAPKKPPQPDFLELLFLKQPLAEQGDAQAQYELGELYCHAKGENQDYKQAALWYRQAVRQQHAKAGYALGLMYKQGRGVERDYPQASALFRQSAKRQSKEAMLQLGLMHEFGLGVPLNLNEARRWYLSSGEVLAKERLEKLGPAPAAPSIELVRKRAEQGDVSAIVTLADRHSFDHGADEDLAQARLLYQQAAQKGNGDARYMLGYLDQYQKPVDWGRVATHYKKAAQLGHRGAQRELGLLYQRGRGVKRSFELAVHWLQLAARQGDVVAQTSMALLARLGRGVAKSGAAAYEWNLGAATGGYPEAQYEVAVALEEGTAVAKDASKAVGWFQRAARSGHLLAQRRLREKGVEWVAKASLADRAEALRRDRETSDKRLISSLVERPERLEQFLQQVEKRLQKDSARHPELVERMVDHFSTIVMTAASQIDSVALRKNIERQVADMRGRLLGQAEGKGRQRNTESKP